MCRAGKIYLFADIPNRDAFASISPYSDDGSTNTSLPILLILPYLLKFPHPLLEAIWRFDLENKGQKHHLLANKSSF